jgi:hypothetical protein
MKQLITKQHRLSSQQLIAISLIAASLISSVSFIGRAGAIPFTQAFLRLDRLAATTATGGRVCLKPSSANAASVVASIKVTFPTTSGTDYVVNATAANWTVTTTGLDAGQTAMPTIGTANNVTAKSVTFPLGTPQALSASNLYCFNFSPTNTLTTSSAVATETTQGNILTQTAAPLAIDQTTYSEYIISSDQITISNATVPPSFQFLLSGNTDAFTANLVPGNVVTTTGRTIQIITNAATGWIVWAQDLATNSKAGNGALSSTVANYKIGGSTAPGVASHTLTAEDYGMGVTVTANNSGSAAASTAYDGSASKVGTLSPGAYLPIASANNPTNNDTIQMQELARSSATTPAASDYSDTLTFVGAGKF